MKTIFIQFDENSLEHNKDYKSFNYIEVDQDKDLRINKKLELAAREKVIKNHSRFHY